MSFWLQRTCSSTALWSALKMLWQMFAALQKLKKEKNYLFFIVSNQPRELILLEERETLKRSKNTSKDARWNVCIEKSYISFRASINKHDSWKNWQSRKMTASRLYLDTTLRRLYFNTSQLWREHRLNCSHITAIFVTRKQKLELSSHCFQFEYVVTILTKWMTTYTKGW